MKKIIAALLCASTFAYAGGESKPCMVQLPSSDLIFVQASTILGIARYDYNTIRIRLDSHIQALKFENPSEIPLAIKQLVEQINRCQNGG